MNSRTKDMLAILFKVEILDQDKAIDPEETYEWETLVYGWALGKGLTPQEALKYANDWYNS